MKPDLVSSLVDHDAMVKPTENDQLTMIGATPESPWSEMVNLKPSVAVAAVSCAGEPGFGQKRPLQRRWCSPGPTPIVHEPAVLGSCSDFDVGVTENCMEGVPTGTHSRFQCHTRFTVG